MSRGTKTTGFLKECMADALIKLMRTKPIDKISVQEITDLAGVGRATWFRNYSSKNEALTFKLICLWNRWAEDHGFADLGKYTVNLASEFFHFSYSVRELYDIIYSAELQFAIYDAFYQIMQPQFEASVKEFYQIRFYSYGLFGLLDEWIRRDYKESPEEMTRLFRNVFPVRKKPELDGVLQPK